MKKTHWLISSLFLVGSAFASSSLVIDVDESNFDVDQTELVTKDLESIQAREDSFSLGTLRGEIRRPGPAPRPGTPRPGGPGHGGPGGPGHGGPGGPGHGGPGHGGGHGGPVNYAGWYPAVGQNCLAYCGSIGLNVGYSPEGTQCASGEVLPLSAQQVGVAQVYGCWGSGCTGLTDYVRGAFSVGNYCYMPRQKQDRDRTDITVACYCQ